jgi:hypothetical protein
MKRLPPARQTRGFMLLDVIFWLCIITALLFLMTDMMVAGLKITRETTARDILIGRVDTALDAMRRDAWGAESIQAINSQVAFVYADRVILWRLEPGGVLTRLNPSASSPPKIWKDMPALTFSADGPLLKVDVASGPGAARHEFITLASQRMLAGGAP